MTCGHCISAALDNPQHFPRVPATDSPLLAPKFTAGQCLVYSKQVDLAIISPLPAGTLLSFVSRDKGETLKEEGVSLPISIPLCWLAQLCRVCARQALAAHAPSAGPSSRSTQGFPSTWFQWVSNFSNT